MTDKNPSRPLPKSIDGETADDLSPQEVFVLICTGSIAGLVVGAFIQGLLNFAGRPEVGTTSCLSMLGAGSIYGAWSARSAADSTAQPNAVMGHPIVWAVGVLSGSGLVACGLSFWYW
ncbi:MAG: hypothetical protein AB8G99_13965 [Planctomycetaceae bacterium]